MREIKFKGVHPLSKVVMDVCMIDWMHDEVLFEQGSDVAYTIEECKLMQYTGLKDKNGVEIYEGDIIPYGNKNYEVVYEAPSFTLKYYFVIDYYGHDAPELQDWSEFEVIGNIHQNPELLK